MMAKVKLAALVATGVVTLGVAGGVLAAEMRGGAATQAASAPAGMPLWNEVLAGWTAGQGLIRSVDVKYEVEEKWTKAASLQGSKRGYTRALRKLSYAKAGEKEFQKSDVTFIGAADDGSDIVSNSVMAFDGQIGRSRHSSSRGTLFTGTTGVARSLNGATPVAAVTMLDPEHLRRQIADGTFELTSVDRVDLGGKATICVQVKSRKTGYRVSIWFSTTEGCLAVRSEDYDNHGQLAGEAVISEIAAITASDGATVHFPIVGYRRVLTSGRELTRLVLKVDRSSLRINEELPDEMFVLQAEPGETVRDTDQQVDIK